MTESKNDKEYEFYLFQFNCPNGDRSLEISGYYNKEHVFTSFPPGGIDYFIKEIKDTTIQCKFLDNPSDKLVYIFDVPPKMGSSDYGPLPKDDVRIVTESLEEITKKASNITIRTD